MAVAKATCSNDCWCIDERTFPILIRIYEETGIGYTIIGTSLHYLIFLKKVALKDCTPSQFNLKIVQIFKADKLS